jgi:eukaryotic-like serine/threonine-protein kinase
MGRVYQALDKKEERRVALKILHVEVAEDEVSVERFKREFAYSAALPHDCIVEVFDFQETEGKSYALVMEYLEGEELRTRIDREKVIPSSPTRRPWDAASPRWAVRGVASGGETS